MADSFLIRTVSPEEVPLLRTFLYHAIFIPEGVAAPSVSIVDDPSLAVYYNDFGQGNFDRCLVAEEDSALVGAVWCRYLDGYSYSDGLTPSLAISVLPSHRRKGIGKCLLDSFIRLLVKDGIPRIGLSVQRENYALEMYKNFGFKVFEDKGDEILMVLELV